jgi:hypothetical protein
MGMGMGAGSGVGDLIELTDAFEVGDTDDLIDVGGRAAEGSSAVEVDGEGVRGRRMARESGSGSVVKSGKGD